MLDQPRRQEPGWQVAGRPEMTAAGSHLVYKALLNRGNPPQSLLSLQPRSTAHTCQNNPYIHSETVITGQSLFTPSLLTADHPQQLPPVICSAHQPTCSDTKLKPSATPLYIMDISVLWIYITIFFFLRQALYV